jgi:hypothetical protein
MLNESDNIPKLLSAMWDLGLDQDICMIYVYLLVNGPSSFDQLKKVIHAPEEKAKDSIKELLGLRLVGSDRRRNTVIYYATDPSIAWLAIVADLVWSTKVDIGSIRNLSKTKDLTIERSRNICNQITVLAQSLYEPHPAISQHREHDTQTSDELSQLICECIYLLTLA